MRKARPGRPRSCTRWAWRGLSPRATQTKRRLWSASDFLRSSARRGRGAWRRASRRLVDVEDWQRIGVQRMHGDVGGEQAAVRDRRCRGATSCGRAARPCVTLISGGALAAPGARAGRRSGQTQAAPPHSTKRVRTRKRASVRFAICLARAKGATGRSAAACAVMTGLGQARSNTLCLAACSADGRAPTEARQPRLPL